MRTYLAYPSVAESVSILHDNMLPHCGSDILNILDAIHEVNQDVDLSEHPEVIRWKDHAPFLCELGMVLGERLRDRIDPRVGEAMIRRAAWHYATATSGQYSMKAPSGWGDGDYHTAEKAALLRLMPEHYANIFPGVPFGFPPYWMMSHGRSH